MSQGTEVVGYVFEDANGNGVKDLGEVPISIQSIVYGNGNDVANTDDNGFFRAFPPVGLQILNYQLPHYYTNTTPFSQNINVQLNVIDTLYFGIQPISNINDLKVQIYPYTFPRPGFTRNYQLSYTNVGTNTLNDVVVKFLRIPEDTFVSASGSYTISNDTLLWNLGTLQPFSSGSFMVTLNLSASATLGDSTHTQAWITPYLNDTTPLNNTVSFKELIIGSYDPNDKSVKPERSEPTVNDPMEYTIRFQNTGNYQADFVIIKDALSSHLELSTFQMIAASHSYEVAIANRVATWTFANINLPDSTSDEPGSHGFVKFRIKRIPRLGLGTQIPNHADIYFDYNPPIITNTCFFSIEEKLSVDAMGNDIGLVVYPNPTNGTVSIAFEKLLNNVTITLTDLQGKIVFNKHLDATIHEQIEIDGSAGLYFLNVKTPQGQSVVKLIKE
jgi:uncharacterized repeat protein (TIGR01451 family)